MSPAVRILPPRALKTKAIAFLMNQRFSLCIFYACSLNGLIVFLLTPFCFDVMVSFLNKLACLKRNHTFPCILYGLPNSSIN